VETALIMDQKLEEIGEMMDVLVTVLMNGIKRS
jgi:hypothetical protein